MRTDILNFNLELLKDEQLQRASMAQHRAHKARSWKKVELGCSTGFIRTPKVKEESYHSLLTRFIKTWSKRIKGLEDWVDAEVESCLSNRTKGLPFTGKSGVAPHSKPKARAKGWIKGAARAAYALKRRAKLALRMVVKATKAADVMPHAATGYVWTESPYNPNNWGMGLSTVGAQHTPQNGEDKDNQPLKENSMSNRVEESLSLTKAEIKKVIARAEAMKQPRHKAVRYFPTLESNNPVIIKMQQDQGHKNVMLNPFNSNIMLYARGYSNYTHVVKIEFRKVGTTTNFQGRIVPTVTPQITEVITRADWLKQETIPLFSKEEDLPNVPVSLINNPLLEMEMLAKFTMPKDAFDYGRVEDILASFVTERDIQVVDDSLFSYEKDKGRQVCTFTEDFLGQHVQIFSKTPEGGEEKAIKRLSSIVDCEEAMSIDIKVIVKEDENIDGLMEMHPGMARRCWRKANSAGKIHKRLKFKPNTRLNARVFDMERMFKGDVRLSRNVPMGEIWVYGNVNLSREVKLITNKRSIVFLRLGDTTAYPSISRPCFMLAGGFMEVFQESFMDEMQLTQDMVESGSFVSLLAKMDDDQPIGKLARLYLEQKKIGKIILAAETLLKIFFMNQKKTQFNNWFRNKKTTVRGGFKVSPGPVTSGCDLGAYRELILSTIAKAPEGAIHHAFILNKEMYMSKKSLGAVSFSHGTLDFDDKLEVFMTQIMQSDSILLEGAIEPIAVVTYKALCFRWPVGWAEVREYYITLVNPERLGVKLYPSLKLITPAHEQDCYDDLFPTKEKVAAKLAKPMYPMSPKQVKDFVVDENFIGKFYNFLMVVLSNKEYNHPILRFNTSDIVDGQVAGEKKELLAQAKAIIESEKTREFIVDSFFSDMRLKFLEGISFEDGELSQSWAVFVKQWETANGEIHKKIVRNVEILRKHLNLSKFDLLRFFPKAADLASKWGNEFTIAMAQADEAYQEADNFDEGSLEYEQLIDMENNIHTNMRREIINGMLAVFHGEEDRGMSKEYQMTTGMGLLINFLMKFGKPVTDMEGYVLKDENGVPKVSNGMISFLYSNDVIERVFESLDHMLKGGKFVAVRRTTTTTTDVLKFEELHLKMAKLLKMGHHLDEILYERRKVDFETDETSDMLVYSIFEETDKFFKI